MAVFVEGAEAIAGAEQEEVIGRHELDEGALGPLRAEMAPPAVVVPATPRLSTMGGRALLPSPTSESWEFPLTRNEKFHRVLGMMEAELVSADGRANRLEARVLACPSAARQANVPAAGLRGEGAEEKAKRLEQELLSMHATVASISQEARTSRGNAHENVDLKGRIELCKSVMDALMTQYDFPEDLATKMRDFLRVLVPNRAIQTADGEEADEEDGGPDDAGAIGEEGDAGATRAEGVWSYWRQLNEAIQAADEPALRSRGTGEAQDERPLALEDEDSFWARSKAILAELSTWSVETSTVPPGTRP